jgi:hypothetical protein
VELVPSRRNAGGAGPGRPRGASRFRWAARRHRPVARRYLIAGLTLEQFFDELNAHGVRYVVLRWFETLPDVDVGEDIDLLVADEDLPFVGTLLVSQRVAPQRQKFDVYTVSGLSGSDWQGIPYFTPRLANRLLERSVLLRNRYRVPSPLDHFDSLAYHAVYHKGERSGLPTGTVDQPSGVPGEHDYADVLSRLAADNRLSVPITLKGLDTYLAGKGLRPPLDTLDKLSEFNGWLLEHVDEMFGPEDAGLPGLAVFVLRERAAHLVGRLCEELRREGWEPLETVALDPEGRARVRAVVRGGTWGRGPLPRSGGGPVTFVIAYDLSAAAPGGAVACDQDRVLRSKVAVRRRLLNGVPADERYNPLHSSDNPRQALEYLGLLPDAFVLPRVRDQIERIRAEMVFPFPVVELLPSRRRRAVTAVVEHPEYGQCVCKLFFPGARRFLLRELRSRTEFGGLPEVPALLAADANWLLMPRYTDTGTHVRRRLPGGERVQLRPSASLALARMALTLHEHGAFLLDLTPQNLMTDPQEGLKVLDWEFLQDFPRDRSGRCSGPARSPTVLGRATDLPGVDTPLGVSADGAGTVTVFHPTVTGIPARLLLRAPWKVQTLLMEPGMLAALVLRIARMAVRRAGKGLRRVARAVLRWRLTHLESRSTAARGRPR